MKILQISDFAWTEPNKDEIINKTINAIETERPDVVVMPGDLIVDGWSFDTDKSYYYPHIDKILKIFKYLEKKAIPTLIIPGNHDLGFKEDYEKLLNHISEFKYVQDISGKIVNVKGVSFLGLGENQVRKSKLQQLMGYPKVDVVLAHVKLMHHTLLNFLNTKIILSGHLGIYLVFLPNNIPVIHTENAPDYATIITEFDNVIDIFLKRDKIFLKQDKKVEHLLVKNGTLPKDKYDNDEYITRINSKKYGTEKRVADNTALVIKYYDAFKEGNLEIKKEIINNKLKDIQLSWIKELYPQPALIKKIRLGV